MEINLFNIGSESTYGAVETVEADHIITIARKLWRKQIIPSGIYTATVFVAGGNTNYQVEGGQRVIDVLFDPNDTLCFEILIGGEDLTQTDLSDPSWKGMILVAEQGMPKTLPLKDHVIFAEPDREAERKSNTSDREAERTYLASDREAERKYSTSDREAERTYLASDREAERTLTTVPTTPGLTTSGLTTSGLTTSGLTTSGLTTSGLTTSGLTTPGLITSEWMRQIYKQEREVEEKNTQSFYEASNHERKINLHFDDRNDDGVNSTRDSTYDSTRDSTYDSTRDNTYKSKKKFISKPKPKPYSEMVGKNFLGNFKSLAKISPEAIAEESPSAPEERKRREDEQALEKAHRAAHKLFLAEWRRKEREAEEKEIAARQIETREDSHPFIPTLLASYEGIAFPCQLGTGEPYSSISPLLARHLGYDPEKDVSRVEIFFDFVDPEDREKKMPVRIFFDVRREKDCDLPLKAAALGREDMWRLGLKIDLLQGSAVFAAGQTFPFLTLGQFLGLRQEIGDKEQLAKTLAANVKYPHVISGVLNNLLKNPKERKYHVFKIENVGFREKIMADPSALSLFTLLGFKEDAGKKHFVSPWKNGISKFERGVLSLMLQVLDEKLKE